MRLAGKVAIVVGAGQTPGDTIGNGRAVALLFAREGARVLLVDRDADSAGETLAMIAAEGGTASVCQADATIEDDCRRMAEQCVASYGRIDILHNNIGISTGDDEVIHLAEEAWDRIMTVNVKSAFLTSKHVLPIMRQQESGVILNISSVAAISAMPRATYKVSKAALNALTQNMAITNAHYGIRVNCIMPGLMETPMAIENIAARRGIAKDELIRERDARVPLRKKMGTAWDVAHAALFLASDEAKFITGVLLPVDGGQSIKVG